jgi:hypothetical protein
MALGSYTIEIDAVRKLLRLQLIGFWTPEIAAAFVEAQQAAVRRISFQPHQHLVLADLSAFNLQSQVVVGICRDLIAKAPLPSKRLAIVGGEGLARIQIKRILVRDRMEVFSNVSSAEDWLFRVETDRLAG